jgi:2-polyprenyl-6-methoxyphenol hydroxylase-like FAD-dependent oxidoreductase
MVRIAIVGGGIGGLTTALTLREFGFESEVYEQAPALLDVGAAIAIWPNAMHVLERIKLTNMVREHSGAIEEINWLDRRGQLLNRALIRNAVALHRADLQSILLHALPPGWIKLDHSLVSCRQTSEKVVATFANGETIEADLLIGADGIHSDARSLIIKDGAPIYRGYTVWRAISLAAPSPLPTGTAIEIHGRGLRFGIGPVGAGKIGWWAAANAPSPDHSSGEEARNKLLHLFKDWYRPAVELIEATPSYSILTTPAFDREPTQTWGDKRITLLGDAIHPTTPNFGQGGCLAMEDAVVLARCFEKYGANEEALRKYEGCRYERTAAITKYSRLYGTIGQSENFAVRISKNILLPLAPEPVLQRLMQIVFDYDATTVTV